MRVYGTPEERLWQSVAVNDGCWPWLGHIKSNGYGVITINKKKIHAHRFMYEYVFGDIPTKLVIDHMCNRLDCVNPAHLQAITQRQNIHRGASPIAKQSKQTHCKRGHMFNVENTYSWRGHRRCVICDSQRRKEKLYANL